MRYGECAKEVNRVLYLGVCMQDVNIKNSFIRFPTELLVGDCQTFVACSFLLVVVELCGLYVLRSNNQCQSVKNSL